MNADDDVLLQLEKIAMAADVCANCGEPITLTSIECDLCGWAPASKRMRQELADKKARYLEIKEQHKNA